MKAKLRHYLHLSIIVFLILGLFLPLPAQAEEPGNQDPVKVHDTEVGLSKSQVFEGEIFYVKASARITLNQDVNFRNVATAELRILATHRETGSSFILTDTSASIGPFIDLKKGTTFTYTLLNIPVKFPPDAPVGEYKISLELVRVKPESVWKLVKERVAEVSMDLGTIRYLGVSTPEITLNLSAPQQVKAGGPFSVGLDVKAPGIDEVEISLYTQKGAENWSLEKKLTSAAVDSLSQEITAPIYGGKLEVIAQATGFSVMGVSSSLDKPVTTSATTEVILPSPTMGISVANPVALGKEVPCTITVDNPSPSIEKLEIQLQPSWTKEPRMLTVSLKQGENTFEEALAPLPSTGEYSLAARASRYSVAGKWVDLSPPLEASALITTEEAPSAALALEPSAVFPGVGAQVEIKVVNPTSGDIVVPYRVYLGTLADSPEQALGLEGRVLWKDGESSILAGAVKVELLDYVFTEVGALEAETPKYLGFELAIEAYSVSGSTIILEPPIVSSAYLTVKPIAPPVIQITPSAPLVDAGQPVTLTLELKNPIDASMDFTLELWERISTDAGEESLVGTESVSLGSGDTVRFSMEAIAPGEPVEVKYEARITEIKLAGMYSLPVEVAASAKVKVKLLVPPQIDLLLNPNPVLAGSSLEARLTATNTSERDMTIPFNLYLKLPGKAQEPWKKQELSLAAGMSHSISEYLLIPEAWQSLGTVEVIAEIESFSLGEYSVNLESPLRIAKSFSIVSLQLRAILKTALEPGLLALDYDAQSGYLIAKQVGLDGTIRIDNASGWENAPNIWLSVKVTQSLGVQMVEEWERIEIQTGELYGKRLTLQGKFIVTDPTAEGLKKTGFSVQVNVEGGIQDIFSLGISRIESGGWYLDSQARLIDKKTGGPFKGAIPGAQLPKEYLGKATKEKAGKVQDILGKVDSLIIDIQTFRDSLESGDTILPTALKAYERLAERGSSLMADLEMLRNQGILKGASLDKIEELDKALEELAGLETLVQDKYGDNPTPMEVTAEKFQETLGRQDSEELSKDPDGDGLITATELQLGYDPYVWDSQQPGISDGEYLANSMAQGEELDQPEEDFLDAWAGLSLLHSGGIGLEEEDIRNYEELTEDAQEQAQQQLQDATWEFFKALLG